MIGAATVAVGHKNGIDILGHVFKVFIGHGLGIEDLGIGLGFLEIVVVNPGNLKAVNTRHGQNLGIVNVAGIVMNA